jgi:hypothetical protein
MRRFALTLAIISTCLGAVAQGKIILGNDSLHLIYGNDGPVPQVGFWTVLNLQLWGGTSAASMTLQTTIVGDAIGNVAFADGRINNRNITLVGVPTSATAYLQLRFLLADSLSVVGGSPIFTVTAGSFAPNPIVLHGPPGNSTWADAPIYLGCLSCPPYWMYVSAYPLSATAGLGSDVTFWGSASPYHPRGVLRYQWYKNGSPMVGATNRDLTLPNVSLSDSGSYLLNANDDDNYGSSGTVTLSVFIPAIAATLGSPTYTANNEFQFTVTGTAGSNYVVQVSTNLSANTDWVSLFTNASPFLFVDTNASNFPRRFYRAHSP